jgi:hypothetical protein
MICNTCRHLLGSCERALILMMLNGCCNIFYCYYVDERVMLQPVISVYNLCPNYVTKFCQINSCVPNRDGCSVFWCREYRVGEVYSPNTLEKTPPNKILQGTLLPNKASGTLARLERKGKVSRSEGIEITESCPYGTELALTKL